MASKTRCCRYAAIIKVFLLTVFVFLGYVLFSGGSSPQAGPKEINKYVGVEQCKACHSSKETGDQYGVWLKTRHSKAWPSLKSEHAMEEAKERNITDPQKSRQCLACHVTAYELPANVKDKDFDPTKGVQCESCHGPGGDHVKARTLALQGKGFVKGPSGVRERIQIPKGEIINAPTQRACRMCHAKRDEPCLQGVYPKIAHLDPRKNRRKDYVNTCWCVCADCVCRKPGKEARKPKHGHK